MLLFAVHDLQSFVRAEAEFLPCDIEDVSEDDYDNSHKYRYLEELLLDSNHLHYYK